MELTQISRFNKHYECRCGSQVLYEFSEADLEAEALEMAGNPLPGYSLIAIDGDDEYEIYGIGDQLFGDAVLFVLPLVVH